MTPDEERSRRRLFAWLKVTLPWPERISEIEDIHLQGLAADLGVTPAQLQTILPFVPEESFANAQIAMDEDFLTYHFDGETAVDAYLQAEGHAETDATRAFLLALRDTPLSLYEVIDVVADSHWLLRDRLGNTAPVHIGDAWADDGVTSDSTLAARIVAVGDRRFIAEGMIALPNPVATVIVDIFANQQATLDDQFPDIAAEHGIPLTAETRLRMGRQLLAGVVTGAYFMHLLGNVMSTLGSLETALSGTSGHSEGSG
jgi:hypothetical protein